MTEPDTATLLKRSIDHVHLDRMGKLDRCDRCGDTALMRVFKYRDDVKDPLPVLDLCWRCCQRHTEALTEAGWMSYRAPTPGTPRSGHSAG